MPHLTCGDWCENVEHICLRAFLHSYFRYFTIFLTFHGFYKLSLSLDFCSNGGWIKIGGISFYHNVLPVSWGYPSTMNNVIDAIFHHFSLGFLSSLIFFDFVRWTDFLRVFYLHLLQSFFSNYNFLLKAYHLAHLFYHY